MNEDFPHVRHLMDSYFNQDYDLYGESDIDILQIFVEESTTIQIDATLMEIEKLLNLPLNGLNERYRNEISRDNVLVGNNDVEVRDWLRIAARVLALR